MASSPLPGAKVPKTASFYSLKNRYNHSKTLFYFVIYTSLVEYCKVNVRFGFLHFSWNIAVERFEMHALSLYTCVVELSTSHLYHLAQLFTNLLFQSDPWNVALKSGWDYEQIKCSPVPYSMVSKPSVLDSSYCQLAQLNLKCLSSNAADGHMAPGCLLSIIYCLLFIV